MPGLAESPDHHQQWYWPYRMRGFLYSTRNGFNTILMLITHRKCEWISELGTGKQMWPLEKCDGIFMKKHYRHPRSDFGWQHIISGGYPMHTMALQSPDVMAEIHTPTVIFVPARTITSCHSPVSMVVADGLVPIWHQDICNNRDDLVRSSYIRTETMYAVIISSLWYLWYQIFKCVATNSLADIGYTAIVVPGWHCSIMQQIINLFISVLS